MLRGDVIPELCIGFKLTHLMITKLIHSPVMQSTSQASFLFQTRCVLEVLIKEKLGVHFIAVGGQII